MIDGLLGEMVKRVEKKGRVRSVFVFSEAELSCMLMVCDPVGDNDLAGCFRKRKPRKRWRSLCQEFT